MSATYTPYGEELLSGLSSPWRYASKRMESETQLVNFGRRFYDPETGRFITPDPKGFTSGLNLYSYVSNDPLHQFDLYGLEAIEGDYTFAPNISAFGMGFYHGALDCTPIAWLDMGASAINLLSSQKWSQLKKDWRLSIPGDVLKSYIDPYFLPEQHGFLYKTSYWSGYASGVGSFSIATAGGGLALFAANKASKVAFRTLLFKQIEKQALRKEINVLGNVNILFGQKSVGAVFSHGPFKGRSIAEIAEGLRAGNIHPDQLPIDIVIRDGKMVAFNNRSLLALKRAGTEPTIIRNRTGVEFYELELDKHLRENLPSSTIRVRGGLPGTSLTSP